MIQRHRPSSEIIGRPKDRCPPRLLFLSGCLTLCTFLLILAFLHPSLLHHSFIPIPALSISTHSGVHAYTKQDALDKSQPKEVRLRGELLPFVDLRKPHKMSRRGSSILLESFDSTHRRDVEETFKLGKGGERVMLPSQFLDPKYGRYLLEFYSSVQRWVAAKRHDPRIMNLLLRLVKDPVDRHYLSKGKADVELGRPYKTCAVVGNSGILLTQNHSRLIDSHDTVIRINNARIQGFEDKVGSKTTLAFMDSSILQVCGWRTGCLCHPYGEEVPIVLYISQVVHLMDVVVCGFWHEAPIIVTDPRFDELCMRMIKHYSIKNFVEGGGRMAQEWSEEKNEGTRFCYSSGMQAVMLALGMCEKVSLFGYGKSDGAKHHYHSNQSEEAAVHDYAAEYLFYHDLAHNKPLVPFVSGFVLPSVEIYL